ncbi:MAG: hypothetical protein WBH56_12220, partial [Bacteroidota bacterium]
SALYRFRVFRLISLTTDSGLWFAELISELLSLLTPSNIPKPSLNLDPSTVRITLTGYNVWVGPLEELVRELESGKPPCPPA